VATTRILGTPAATVLSGVKLPQSAQGVTERGTRSVAER
jgi:hypothetical protein